MCYIYDDYCEFWHEEYRKARKQHPCEGCRRKIEIGDLHLYCCGKFEGDMSHYRICGACCLDRQRVHIQELAEGCRHHESWPSPDDLSEALEQHELDRSTRGDGQLWLRRLKATGCCGVGTKQGWDDWSRERAAGVAS